VYITMPTGLSRTGIELGGADKGGKQQVFLLLKSLYGIKQAPHDWNEDVNETILSMRYKRCLSDTCVYVKTSRTGKPIIIPLFVDDMFPAYHRDDRAEWEADKAVLMAKYKIKDLGIANLVLGMRVTRDRKARTLKLDQEVYITKLLESCQMQDCIKAETPQDPRLKSSEHERPESGAISAAQADADELDLEYGELLRVRYGSVVGSLLYAALSTRPDIAYAVGVLARYVSAPLPQHWRAAKYVLRYLKGTASLGLTFRGSTASSTAVTLGPAYADADWGGNIDDRRSTSGTVTKINGCAVSWKSKKQTSVAQSSAEAEYYAAGEGVKDVLWLRRLMGELGFVQHSGTELLGDNQSAIAIAKNDVFHARTKHIDLKHHFIREHVASRAIVLQWVSSKEQEADIFTKALGKHPFQMLRDRVMGATAHSAQ
jgi:hypothetical protein